MYKLTVYEDEGKIYLKSGCGYTRADLEFNGNDVILKPTNDRVDKLVSPIERDISELNKKSEKTYDDKDFKKENRFGRNKKYNLE